MNTQTLDLTKKTLPMELQKTKKNWAWIIAKTIISLIVLAIAIFGMYRNLLVDTALEKLEADLAQSSAALNKAIDERNTAAKTLEQKQAELVEKADDDCKKWQAARSYKISHNLPFDEELDKCIANEATKSSTVPAF